MVFAETPCEAASKKSKENEEEESLNDTGDAKENEAGGMSKNFGCDLSSSHKETSSLSSYDYRSNHSRTLAISTKSPAHETGKNGLDSFISQTMSEKDGYSDPKETQSFLEGSSSSKTPTKKPASKTSSLRDGYSSLTPTDKNQLSLYTRNSLCVLNSCDHLWQAMNSRFYNTALIRGVSDHVVNGLAMKNATSPVDVEKARREHRHTAEVLKSLDLNVVEIPADPLLPDCVFIEDPVFFCENKAFYPRMKADSRQPEGIVVRSYVESHFPRLITACMDNPEAHLDGGDICFVGGQAKEILCGLSQRTNSAGVAQLQKSFPNYQVTPIEIPAPSNGGLLHLITMTSICEAGVLAIGKSDAAQALKKTIQKESHTDLEFFDVEDDWAANCIRANGHTLHCSKEEYPKTYAQFQDRYGDLGIPLKNEEFEKIDGSLTCRVRLFNYNY